VNALPDDLVFTATEHLLREAFDDNAVAASYMNGMPDEYRLWATQEQKKESRGWLDELMADHARLIPYVAPRYYAEREGHASAMGNPYRSLGVEFAELLVMLQDQGYFPNALPRDCVDDPTEWGDVSVQVSRAIHMPFTWDGDPHAATEWSEPLIYSLVEYFHDQAQRPRTPGTFHSFAGCGPHYADHSAESGGAVYRWRVNALLDSHAVGMNLGKLGDERGRLVHRFGTPLDDAADQRAAQGADDPGDEVAHAIRDFRERGASATQKRGALVLLAGALELRRQEVKVVLGKDEDVLFRLANEFGLRHRNDRQRMNYGDEFLDYMFSAYLSAVTLMEALERRSDVQAPSVAPDTKP
jgi:hypothetical protein